MGDESADEKDTNVGSQRIAKLSNVQAVIPFDLVHRQLAKDRKKQKKAGKMMEQKNIEIDQHSSDRARAEYESNTANAAVARLERDMMNAKTELDKLQTENLRLEGMMKKTVTNELLKEIEDLKDEERKQRKTDEVVAGLMKGKTTLEERTKKQSEKIEE